MRSPNFGDRRGRAIDALILHYTGMVSGAAALARLCDPASEVSCHYLVWEDGRIDQLVAESARAWHAGRSYWAGETDLNAVSIGIELVNGGHDFGCPPYPPAQIEALTGLCRDVCARHRIANARVLAHSDIAPARKRDPGEHFPWQALAEAGVGVWADPVAADRGGAALVGTRDRAVAQLQRRFSDFGYDCPPTGELDDATRRVVTAFQRHWRPAIVDGSPDAASVEILAALSSRH